LTAGGGLYNLLGPDLLFRLIAIVLGIAVHEFGHAAMALLVGDQTARRQGRVTLNPLAHLDVLGLICIFIAGFGWGKPVMFDPRHIRINKRLGIILIALAGPFMSAVLGLLSIGFLYTSGAADPANAFWQGGAGLFLANTFIWLAYINLSLAIFNLIPIPPLDGWKVLMFSLPPRTYPRLYRFERIGPFLLLLLLIIPFGQLLIQDTIRAVLSWFNL
jgi:Zn-dependent protease